MPVKRDVWEETRSVKLSSGPSIVTMSVVMQLLLKHSGPFYLKKYHKLAEIGLSVLAVRKLTNGNTEHGIALTL